MERSAGSLALESCSTSLLKSYESSPRFSRELLARTPLRFSSSPARSLLVGHSTAFDEPENSVCVARWPLGKSIPLSKEKNMSLSPGGSPLGASPQPAAQDPRIFVIQRMRRGAGWFLTIAILSGVNSLLQIFDAKIRFIFGLGITQVVDAIGHGAGQNGMFVTIAVDGIFIVMLILCSRWAKAGSQGAFLGGNDRVRAGWRVASGLQRLARCGGARLCAVHDLAGLRGSAGARANAASRAARALAAHAALKGR